jgi:hypothetical protein
VEIETPKNIFLKVMIIMTIRNTDSMEEKYVIISGGYIYCGSNSKVALQKVLDTFMNMDLIYNYYIIANESLKDEVKSSNYFVVTDE